MARGWLTPQAVGRTAWRVLSEPRYVHPLLMHEAVRRLRTLWPRGSSGRAGRIRQCSIKITDLCNLRCHTCGQWGDQGYLLDVPLPALRERELPPERWIDQFRDLARNGHRPNIYFWGGEPMLYTGIVDLIEEAARLGMPPSIATNGTHLEREAERLVRAPMFLVQVSIDGPEAKPHNACRPGADPRHDNFTTAERGLAALQGARRRARPRLPLLATLTTISRRNVGRLVEIYESFRERVDLLVFYLGWWIDQAALERHGADFAARFGSEPRTAGGWLGGWRPDDFAGLAAELAQLRHRSRHGPPVIVVPNVSGVDEIRTYYTDHAALLGFSRCVALYSAVEVLPNGDVSPCRDYSDYIVGNVRQQSLHELWGSERFAVFRKSLATRGLMPVCARCCGLMGN
jgi:radical SAM protein with 4Fe4S-binding SPASM domain